MAPHIEPPAAAPAVQAVHPDLVLLLREGGDDARQPAGRLHRLERRQPDRDDDGIGREESRDGGEGNRCRSPAPRDLTRHRDACRDQRDGQQTHGSRQVERHTSETGNENDARREQQERDGDEAGDDANGAAVRGPRRVPRVRAQDAKRGRGGEHVVIELEAGNGEEADDDDCPGPQQALGRRNFDGECVGHCGQLLRSSSARFFTSSISPCM